MRHHSEEIVWLGLPVLDNVLVGGAPGDTRPTVPGERRHLTGETARERGTGDEERGVVPSQGEPSLI